MKKNEKTLNWRLSELPTAGEVAELVDSGVITTEEAREILFSEASSSDEKVKALEEQVEFLQGLVEKLASRNVTNITSNPFTYTRTINTPDVYWNGTKKVLCNTGLAYSTTAGSGMAGTTINLSSKIS